MPPEVSPTSYFKFPATINNNMAGAQACEVEVILATLFQLRSTWSFKCQLKLEMAGRPAVNCLRSIHT
jgi:hypothetical protein